MDRTVSGGFDGGLRSGATLGEDHPSATPEHYGGNYRMVEVTSKICGHPWSWKNVPGAGIQLYAPVEITGSTGPQMFCLWSERWVQFEPKGWHDMQMANADLIVRAVNQYLLNGGN
jgi:hypothetical protein